MRRIGNGYPEIARGQLGDFPGTYLLRSYAFCVLIQLSATEKDWENAFYARDMLSMWCQERMLARLLMAQTTREGR